MDRAHPDVDPARAHKAVKTLFGWLFLRRISMPLSLRLARTRVRPMQITMTGLACGLAGAGFLFAGSYGPAVAGAILVVVAKVLDAADGEVARAKHLDSPLGYVVDGLSDRLRDTAVIAGAGLGVHRVEGVALQWTLAAVSGYLFFFYVSGASPSHWREIRTEDDLDDKHMFRVAPSLRLGAGDTLVVSLVVAALVDRLEWWIGLVALAAPVAIVLKVRRLLVRRPWERDATSELHR
ncbi:MAG TPA: CDP-alcohol phosphatidyltransferase family protein [Actinomycetota bacterium]|nr:CDP-alcohol phosphatidyltransferase family protein [Actinomycetota bacterium]